MEKYAVGEEEARGLRALLEVGDTTARNVSAIQAIGPGKIDERIQSMRDKFPFIAREQEARSRASEFDIAGFTGGAGASAGAFREKRIEFGRALEEKYPEGSQIIPGMVNQEGQAGSLLTWLIDKKHKGDFPEQYDENGKRILENISSSLQNIEQNTRPIKDQQSTPSRNANI
jgi:hypothetical protein